MKVLFIEPSGGGGIAHYTYCLAHALGAMGTACEIITSNRWVHRELPDCVSVQPDFKGLRTNLLSLFLRVFRNRRQISWVHWQSTTHPQLLFRLMQILPLRRRPWVYTVHNVLPHERNPKSMALYHKIYHRMNGLIFHTEDSRRTFQQYFPSCSAQTTVIPLGEFGFLAGKNVGVDHRVYPRHNHSILFFGNIRPYKGLDVLLQAFAEVSRAIPSARLFIIGQELQHFDPYREQIRNLQLEAQVEVCLGYVPDEEIFDIFSQFPIVVLPYKEIDQSAVLLLALALGKAVIASNVGGIPEVIKEGETGILVSPGNAHLLAQAIVRLLNDPEFAARLGNAAKADVRIRFSWKTIAERTLAFYRSLLS